MTRLELQEILLGQAFEVAGSLALFGVLVLVTRPDVRAAIERRIRGELWRRSGAEARAWLASPAAAFARRRRDELVAQEFAEQQLVDGSVS